MPKFDAQLNEAWWALRAGLGGGLIVAGTDKFFNLLTDWSMYLSTVATKIVPVKAAMFMHAVGIIEILLGALLLTRWTRIASIAVIFWLAGIVANLTITGMFYDLAKPFEVPMDHSDRELLASEPIRYGAVSTLQ